MEFDSCAQLARNLEPHDTPEGHLMQEVREVLSQYFPRESWTGVYEMTLWLRPMREGASDAFELADWTVPTLVDGQHGLSS